MEQVKEKVAEKVGEEETTNGWTGFVQEVGEWLLGEKAETRNTVAKAIAGLISYGATTEEKLQNVADDKKDFRETLAEEGVPKAICDLLFEQYVAKPQGTKRRGSSDRESTPYAKRQRILDRSGPVGIGELFGWLHETSSNEAKDVYSFAKNVLESGNQLLWVRSCYPALYDTVWKKAIRPKGLYGHKSFHPVAVTGTSGIGKSFFGIYTLFRAVREMDLTIVYTKILKEGKEEHYVVAPPKAKLQALTKGDPKRLLLDLQEANEFKGLVSEDPIDETEDKNSWMNESLWWGKVEEHPMSQKFVARLLGGEASWNFVDVQKGSVMESTPRVIILVSDDKESYLSCIKHHKGVVLYMSVWTKEELLEAKEKTGAMLSDEDIILRYSKVGGIPRSVMNEEWEQCLLEINEAINELDGSKLGDTLKPGSNPRVTSRLVHQVSEPPFDQSTVRTVYASEYVRTRIYERFPVCGAVQVAGLA